MGIILLFFVMLVFYQLRILRMLLIFRFDLSWFEQHFTINWFWIIFIWFFSLRGHFICLYHQHMIGRFQWILRVERVRFSCFAYWVWFFSFINLSSWVFYWVNWCVFECLRISFYHWRIDWFWLIRQHWIVLIKHFMTVFCLFIDLINWFSYYFID